MQYRSLLFVGCLVLGILSAGCTGSSETVAEPTVNTTITLMPGDQQTFQVPWMGTYTHVSVQSTLPIEITWTSPQNTSSVTTNDFTVDQKFYVDQSITLANTGSQEATIRVEIAAMKVYKSF